MVVQTPLPFVYWSPKLGDVGEIVTDTEDINQCIRIILTTRKGTVPHRPEFGSNLQDYIDWPQNRAKPFIIRESLEAIERWEPRVRVKQVVVLPTEIAQIRVQVAWTLADGVAENFVEVVV